MTPSKKALRFEVAIVLALTFGASALRALLRLTAAVLDPQPLNQHSVTLAAPQAHNFGIDLGLQLVGSGVLLAWGALAVYLLRMSGTRLQRCGWGDVGKGILLAALIGIPGLVFYAYAVRSGFSARVVPSALEHGWWDVPALLISALANGWAEELVVVAWLVTRARQLGARPWVAVGSSALLRGSYHLYQGFSAGLGNLAMGLIFAFSFHRTGRVWPLVAAHFLVDALAFAGYHLLAGHLAWLGIPG